MHMWITLFQTRHWAFVFAMKSFSPKMFILFATKVNVDADGDRKGKFDLAGNAIPSVVETPKDVFIEGFRKGKRQNISLMFRYF